MIKKLSKYGNSKALIIDKPILQLLNIDEKTDLEITTDGKSLLITPIQKKANPQKKSDPDKKLKKIVAKNIRKYAPTFKKLSKN